jgi:hypothetical protein
MSFRTAQYPHNGRKGNVTPQPKQPAAPLVKAQSATKAKLDDLTARVEALENP